MTPSTETKSMEQSFQSALDSNTLYVGGNGSGNYTKIQDAIDNASNGDTIFVYSGIYYENIIIDKSVNLTGEDRNTTIIDGRKRSSTLYVTADWVNINKFTIRNCSHGLQNASIKIVSEQNSIKNNRITRNNASGIFLKNSAFNIIQNNILFDNVCYNIYLRNSLSNIIRNNLINQSDNWPRISNGISISASSKNIVERNLIDGVNSNVGIGLWELSNNNTIRENTILNIKGFDSNLIQMWESHNNSVINNILLNSNGNGICSGLYSIGNKMIGNIIESMGNKGIQIGLSKDIIVKNNNISSNEIGIIIAIDSSMNSIESNNIKNNNIGIKLVDKRIDPHIIGDCVLNKIRFNNFIGNERMAYDDNLFALNIWYGNYWNRPRALPKAIFGIRTIGDNIKIPVIHFDLRPAKEPYDIPIIV